ncbi:CBN-RME-6 protein [Caenorhabditis brenneri]|uniref:Receptor-mediated endocytosis protein 6 n=1 Tax=Caenorhabditis brenneri TaxID=135651 RepID=G0N7S1_CAEBE|nr:CBN-RME-6 protein [Caenorhabditis brenneri]
MVDKLELIRSQDDYRPFYELAAKIRNQKLLTDAELNSLNRHKQEVQDSEIRLLTEAWRSSYWNYICRQLKNQSLEPTIACRLLKEVAETEALPAYKHVGHHFSTLDQLLTVLYEEPASVAELLNNIDQNDIASSDAVIQMFFHFIYSSGLYPEDELKLAQVVCYLLKLQLLKSGEAMRTMLRKETSMSTRFYKHYVELMHPTMVYLTKALRKSVLDVIQLGNFWLDIDVKQSHTNDSMSCTKFCVDSQENMVDFWNTSFLTRFSTARFLRDPNQNKQRLPEYRALIVSKLVYFVDTFLENIFDALPMLPPNLNWIIRDIFLSLYEVVDDVSAIELSHACKDMIISNLICPAIISPQKFGVVDNDVRIGSISNHNLVQIAMIIQMISLREFETPPEEYVEFLSQCRNTHLIPEMMDALLVEKLAPDVEIISLIASGSAESDMETKTSFVGSVADVNLLTKTIRSIPPTADPKLSRILTVCNKLPDNIVSTVQKSHADNTEASPKMSALRNIHRKVQHSFKRTGDSFNDINEMTAKAIDSRAFEKENFDVFYLEFSSSSTAASPDLLLVESNTPEPPSEETTTNETNSNEVPLETPPEIPPEINQSPGTRGGLAKLMSLGDRMKKGLTQSNTLSDIRGHLRRSGSLVKQQTGLTTSSSEQHLSEVANGPRDDILAKYASISSIKEQKPVLSTTLVSVPAVTNAPEPYYSSENLTGCRAFQDTLRKMITVLGNISYLPRIGYRNEFRSTQMVKKELLGLFIDGALVETEHRRDYGLAAQLREVKRCIELFEHNDVEILLQHLKMNEADQDKVVSEMREERANLMRKSNDISSLEQRVLLNRRLTEQILVDFLMRNFLETGFQTKNTSAKTEEVIAVMKFHEEFKHLEAHDERAEFMKTLMVYLKERLMQNIDWNFATESMLTRAMSTIERYVIFSVYESAFFPNRDVDVNRDRLLQKTIAKVSSNVTPVNDFLKIPEHLHGEAPWPSAQAELHMLDVYVTAQDKLNCVVRCCDVINNLVALSSKNAVASADDLTPVLVFVIIKANPRALLSNLQFIETFAGDRIESGRDAYYWVNFKSAVEYIKTIL